MDAPKVWSPVNWGPLATNVLEARHYSLCTPMGIEAKCDFTSMEFRINIGGVEYRTQDNIQASAYMNQSDIGGLKKGTYVQPTACFKVLLESPSGLYSMCQPVLQEAACSYTVGATSYPQSHMARRSYGLVAFDTLAHAQEMLKKLEEMPHTFGIYYATGYLSYTLPARWQNLRNDWFVADRNETGNWPNGTLMFSCLRIEEKFA